MHSFGLRSVRLSVASTLNFCDRDHMALLLLGGLLGVSYTTTSLSLVGCDKKLLLPFHLESYILTAAQQICLYSKGIHYGFALSNTVLGSRNDTVFNMTKNNITIIKVKAMNCKRLSALSFTETRDLL